METSGENTKTKDSNYNKKNELSLEELQAAEEKIHRGKEDRWINEGRAHSEDGRIIESCQRWY
jgi:hypothetical protein